MGNPLMTAKSKYRKLKRALIVLFVFIIVFALYVEIANRNSKNMTYRQKVLKAAYPVLMWVTKLAGKNSKELSGTKQPPISFYEKLVIIGFPANDFKEQEKGTDEEIAKFCKVNYGVSFPLMKKSIVIKSSQQNPVYQWLTDSTKNGWNDQSPSWNFTKYIVNEGGVLTNYFGPSVSPLSKDVTKAISE